MTVEEARAIALEQPGAAEGEHHGHPDFRVGKTIFATLWPAENRSVLRLPMPLAESLERQEPNLYKIVSRGGGQGWTSVKLPAMDAGEFRTLVEMARDNLDKTQ